MTDRSVTVSLRARVADFNRNIATSTAAVGMLESRLRSADREGGSSIDKLSGRMAIFARVAGAFGPGFVPLLTAAVPLVTGLSTQLGFAAAAGGTAVLAFKGIGGALDALNAYQLEKTPENFAKLQESLRGLGPDARSFVTFLDQIGPKLQRLRTAAQAGMLPGFQEGLDSLLDRLPEMRKIVSEIAEGTGELAADTGAALASSDWDDFFDFLTNEGKPKLLDFGHTLGNLAEAGANLFMGMDPATDDFSTGLLNWSQNLADASENLDDSAKFQEFLAYVQTTGPQALDTLGALANGVLQVGEAAAPLGGPVLEGVEMFADLVSTIADSPLGTPIMGMVAAVSALNLVLGTTKKLQMASLSSGGIFAGGLMSGAPGTMRAQLGMIRQIPAAYSKVAAAEREVAAAQAAQARAGAQARMAGTALIPRADKLAALRTYGAASSATAEAQSKLALANQRVAGTWRQSAAGMAKGVGAATGLALAMSPLPEKVGLTNTATMAMMGTLVGPWGTAAGAAIGLTMDFAAANDDLEAAVKRANSALGSFDLDAMNTQFKQSNDELQNYLDGMNRPSDANPDNFLDALGLGMKNSFTDPVGTFKGISDAISGGSKKAEADVAKLSDGFFDARANAADLAKMLGADFDRSGQFEAGEWESMAEAMQLAQKAMQNLNLDHLDFGDLNPQQLADVAAEIERMDSTKGRLEGVADAISGLSGPMDTAAQSADKLRSALDALLSPGQELSDATDAWNASLRNIDDNLAEHGRSLTANTDAADQNRNAISGMKDNLVDLLVAQRKNGAGAEKLTKTLKNGVNSIISTGKAANLSGKEIRGYLKELDLSPKMIKTIIRTIGVDKAKDGVKGLVDDMTHLDGTRANPKANLHDNASSGIKGVVGRLGDLDKKHANPKVNAETSMAMTRLAAVQAALAAIRSKSVTVSVHRTQTGIVGALGGADGMTIPGFAGGGSPGFTVPGQRQPYGDKMLARNAATGGLLAIAPGEEVISNRHGQADRHRPLLKAINANMFADGGTPGRYDRGSVAKRSTQHVVVSGRLSGTMRTPYGDVPIEGVIENISRGVAREEIDADKAWEGGLAG